MKLIVLNNNLKEGLNAVSRAVAENANLPVLKNILIRTFNNKIRFSATNLEIAVTYCVSGKIIEEGGVTVPFSVLNGIVNNCDSERVSLETDGNALNFKTDNYEAKIQGLGEDEFPIIPKIENSARYITIDAVLFKTYVLKVANAIQISEIRPEISGILLDFQLTQFKLAGTDSFRLAEKTVNEKDFKSNFEQGFKIIIPIKTIQEVVRSLKEGELAMYIDPNQTLFKNGDLEIISRLIDGTYPDYEQIIPKEFGTEMVINRESCLNAVKLVSNLTGKVNDIKVKTKENGKAIEVYSNNQFVGENKYLIPAKTKGDPFEIAFNWRYLMDGLKNFETEDVTVGVNGEMRPALIKNPADNSYFYLIMPLKF